MEGLIARDREKIREREREREKGGGLIKDWIAQAPARG